MKEHIIFSIVITLITLSESLCNMQNESICNANNDCLPNHNCINGSCVHKGYFPPNVSQLFEIAFMCVISTVATSAGVGGGPIYSALLMFIDNLDPQTAFPISSFSILVCSIITFALGVKQKLDNPSMLFIDYDLAVVFCPCLLLGTRIGVILNSIFPDLFLIVALIVFLSLSSFKTYKNALKVNLKERQLEANQMGSKTITDGLVNDNNTASSPINYYDSDSEMIIELIRVERDSKVSEHHQGQYYNHNTDDFYNKSNYNSLFNGLNSPIYLYRVKWVILLQVIMLLDQLLEGNNKIDSIINIKKCSLSFWFIFCCFILFCLIFTRTIYDQIKNEKTLLINSKTDFNPIDSFKITSAEGEAKIIKIIFFCFLAGVFSGMLGIGGGLFMTPLMLELNVNTQIATATSNFFLVFTSFSSTCLFMLGGNLIVSYALMFGFFCGLFAYIGSSALSKFIKRTNKASVLIWILLCVSLLSLVLLPINAITHALYDLKNGKSIFELKYYC